MASPSGRPADRLFVPATGTAAQIEKAFATSLAYHQVQGTKLRLASQNLTVPAGIENTWLPIDPSLDGGSGGGTSSVYPQPSYQAGVVPNSLSEASSSSPMRVEPDISMEADPATGILVGETQTFPDGVYYDTYRIGGTSVSSPLANSLDTTDGLFYTTRIVDYEGPENRCAELRLRRIPGGGGQVGRTSEAEAGRTPRRARAHPALPRRTFRG
jgi:subtilase family serine protease